MQHTSLFTVMRVELCRNQLSICYKRLRRRSARQSHLFQLALWGLFSSQHNAGYNSPEVFLILIAVRASPRPALTTTGLSPPEKPFASFTVMGSSGWRVSLSPGCNRALLYLLLGAFTEGSAPYGAGSLMHWKTSPTKSARKCPCK